MINLISHPIAKSVLTKIRNKNTNTSEFRENLKILSFFIAIESTKNLTLNEKAIETPLDFAKGYSIRDDIILLPILRAGLSMVNSFLELIPDAKIGYVGAKRDEKTLKADEYLFSIPSLSNNSKIIILEPMIATGGTICQTLNKLLLDGITNISIASIISAPEGIERILSEFPNIEITTAAIDAKLNNFGYIVPGLGDAGDRYVGH